MLYKSRISFIILLFAFSFCRAQETIPLYNGKIPNARLAADEEYSNADYSTLFKVSRPTLSVYLPLEENATGSAVIICPGGGYHALVIDREGNDIANRLVKLGVAAFVLKYRLPDSRTMIDKNIAPLQDAQEALKLVRMNAHKWHIDTEKVGIMGFSAGGHLASTAGTHFNHAYIENKEGINLRPDFMILVYPVISMANDIGHLGSRKNLLGDNPSTAVINKFSNELQVTPETPSAFIVHAEDDSTVKVENSIRFYEALRKYNIPVAIHIYQRGGHGFLKYPPRDLWMNDLVYWMKTNHWLSEQSDN